MLQNNTSQNEDHHKMPKGLVLSGLLVQEKDDMFRGIKYTFKKGLYTF
jgi:hypothetical protein